MYDQAPDVALTAASNAAPTTPTDPPTAWLTIAQLQKRFGIGRTTAYAWAHQLPSDVCMRIGHKKLMVNERKLIAYLEQKGTRHAIR
jgi:hypothetical protein